MKHIYFILFITLLTTSAFGQTQSINTNGSHQQIFQNKKAENICKAKTHGITSKNNSKNAFKSASGNELKLDSTLTENWVDSISQWENIDKIELLYDEYNNTTHEKYFDWNKLEEHWTISLLAEYDFDVNGNKSGERLFFDIDDSTGIDMVYKEENTFNLQGKLSESVITNLDWFTLQIKLFAKIEYSYNDSNEGISSELMYIWNSDSSKWFIDNKTEYAYDNNTLEKTTLNWVDSTSLWINYKKNDYIYDSNGNELSEIKYDVNDSLQWIPLYKSEYSYDTFGNMTQKINSSWKNDDQKWVGWNKEEYFYDENGWALRDIIYDWDETAVDWIFESKNDEPVYDANGNLMEYLVSNWDKDSNEWIKAQKNTYYYSSLIATGVSEITSINNVKVYPNPTSDFVVFDLENSVSPALVDIYNLHGQKLISQKLSNNNKLSLNQLKNGIYIYVLTQGAEINKGKILKK